MVEIIALPEEEPDEEEQDAAADEVEEIVVPDEMGLQIIAEYKSILNTFLESEEEPVEFHTVPISDENFTGHVPIYRLRDESSLQEFAISLRDFMLRRVGDIVDGRLGILGPPLVLRLSDLEVAVIRDSPAVFFQQDMIQAMDFVGTSRASGNVSIRPRADFSCEVSLEDGTDEINLRCETFHEWETTSRTLSNHTGAVDIALRFMTFFATPSGTFPPTLRIQSMFRSPSPRIPWMEPVYLETLISDEAWQQCVGILHESNLELQHISLLNSQWMVLQKAPLKQLLLERTDVPAWFLQTTKTGRILLDNCNEDVLEAIGHRPMDQPLPSLMLIEFHFTGLFLAMDRVQQLVIGRQAIINEVTWIEFWSNLINNRVLTKIGFVANEGHTDSPIDEADVIAIRNCLLSNWFIESIRFVGLELTETASEYWSANVQPLLEDNHLDRPRLEPEADLFIALEHLNQNVSKTYNMIQRHLEALFPQQS